MERQQMNWPVRRRFRRFEMRETSVTMVSDTFARVIDVSVNGLSVETQAQLKMGKSYTFDLSHGNDLLVVNGTIRWSKLHGARKTDTGTMEKVFLAGVNLEELSVHEDMKLTGFIEQFADVAPGEKLFARLNPKPGDASNNNSGIGVKVKNISRRKILVESELGLQLGTSCDVALNLRDQEFKARARIISLEERPDTKPEQRHWIGAEFTTITPEHQTILSDFIRFEVARLKPLRTHSTKPAVLKGNVRSRVFHNPGCRSSGGRECTAEFSTPEEAQAAGFRQCRLCKIR